MRPRPGLLRLMRLTIMLGAAMHNLLPRAGATSIWSPITTSAVVPPARAAGAAGAVLVNSQDSVRNLVVHGGCGDPGTAATATATAMLGDLWALTVGNNNSSQWQQLHTKGGAAAAPAPRCGHAGAADPGMAGRDTLHVFGGAAANGTLLNDLWSLNVPKRTWARRDNSPKHPVPSPRRDHTMNWLSGQLLVVGGEGRGASVLGDCWSWDATGAHDHYGTWKQVAVPAGLSPRSSHAAAPYYGEAGQPFLLLYGGIGGSKARDGGGGKQQAVFDDLWRFDGVRWMALTPRPAGGSTGPASPGKRWGHLAFVLQSSEVPAARLVISGGRNSSTSTSSTSSRGGVGADAGSSMEYDILTNQWVEGAPPLLRRLGSIDKTTRTEAMAAVTLDPPSSFIMFGGKLAGSSERRVEVNREEAAATGTFLYTVG